MIDARGMGRPRTACINLRLGLTLGWCDFYLTLLLPWWVPCEKLDGALATPFWPLMMAFLSPLVSRPFSYAFWYASKDSSIGSYMNCSYESDWSGLIHLSAPVWLRRFMLNSLIFALLLLGSLVVFPSEITREAPFFALLYPAAFVSPPWAVDSLRSTLRQLNWFFSPYSALISSSLFASWLRTTIGGLPTDPSPDIFEL